jgi:hypothetical protein
MERELEAAVDSMSRDKRNELRRKLDECEMEDEATDLGGEQAQGTVSADRETGAVLISFKCYFNMHSSLILIFCCQHHQYHVHSKMSRKTTVSDGTTTLAPEPEGFR